MRELPLPEFYEPGRVGEVWRVPYEERAREGRSWAEQHGIRPSAEDSLRICLLAVDVQIGVPRFWTGVGVVTLIVGSLYLYDGMSLSWITLLVGVVGVSLGMISGMPAMQTRCSGSQYPLAHCSARSQGSPSGRLA